MITVKRVSRLVLLGVLGVLVGVLGIKEYAGWRMWHEGFRASCPGKPDLAGCFEDQQVEKSVVIVNKGNQVWKKDGKTALGVFEHRWYNNLLCSGHGNWAKEQDQPRFQPDEDILLGQAFYAKVRFPAPKPGTHQYRLQMVDESKPGPGRWFGPEVPLEVYVSPRWSAQG